VVRAGLRKPVTGADITDASLPHGRLQTGTYRLPEVDANLIRPALSHQAAVAGNRISAKGTARLTSTMRIDLHPGRAVTASAPASGYQATLGVGNLAPPVVSAAFTGLSRQSTPAADTIMSMRGDGSRCRGPALGRRLPRRVTAPGHPDRTGAPIA
jgi:hypothetical protein